MAAIAYYSMMSSSSNNAADVLHGNGGEKRTHQEMTHSSVSDDDYTLFEKAKERLNAAQEELDLAQQNMERRRQQIRNSGNYEPDSLLCLSDGEGHLLVHILTYLDTNDLGRSGAVCHTLKNQADGCWDTLETRVLTHPSLCSPSAQNCKERVVRYLRASDFASRIGAMGDNISKHVTVYRYSLLNNTMITERVEGCCTGCDYPDLTDNYNRDEYDLFVRLSKTSNNELLTEGFASLDWDDVLLEGLDFSKWPELLEINRLVISQGDEFGLEEGGHEYRLLHNVMRDLTVVIVAVNRLSSEPSLVAANNNFGRDDGVNSADHSIDMMGGHGLCWARGELSTHSHGPVDENENRIKLGVTYDTRTWTDANTGEVLRKECEWKLSI